MQSRMAQGSATNRNPDQLLHRLWSTTCQRWLHRGAALSFLLEESQKSRQRLIYADDAAIVYLQVRKDWADPLFEPSPGVAIRVWQVSS